MPGGGAAATAPSRGTESYRCTRPLALPPASDSTSSTDTRLKSPLIVCLSAEAATANSRASPCVGLVSRPWMMPP